MRLATSLSAAKARLRRPATWGALLAFGALWNTMRWWTTPSRISIGEFLVPFLLGAATLVAGAIPWQWSGDDRPNPSLPRALIQAIPWNLAFVLLAMYLLPETGPGYGRGRGMGQRVDLPLLPALPPRLVVLGIVSFSFGCLAGWILAERDKEAFRAEDALQAARRAQTQALQAQMNPHVLFNALGGLAELARENPAATEAALVNLAELLRALLHHAAKPLATLQEERELVERLLALESFRLGPRLQVRWQWDAALESLELPPLLLQPLVENAIKHGIAPHRGGGLLEISLSGRPERLCIRVANTGTPLAADMHEGVGLSNLRQRLALLQACAGHLQIRTEGERTVAELCLEVAHG